MLAGSDSNVMKTTLRAVTYYKMTLPLLQLREETSPHFSITLSHKIGGITNKSVG